MLSFFWLQSWADNRTHSCDQERKRKGAQSLFAERINVYTDIFSQKNERINIYLYDFAFI